MLARQVRLYSLFSILIAIGYLWIGYVYLASIEAEFTVCPIKLATDFPCPSCGSTRSVLEIINGDFFTALKINPFGFIIIAILIICPLWFGYDILSGRTSFLTAYTKIEKFVSHKYIAIPLIVLVIANWIWNILKGL